MPITVSRSPSAASGRETILLVEDAEPLRKLALRFLENHGYRVIQAQDGEEALTVVRGLSERIQLMLTDVVMPGMNGRVLAEKLLPSHPEMKVLYMSGYTDSFIAGHGVLEQGTALIHKPFSEEDLLAKVREVLDRPAGEAGEHSFKNLQSAVTRGKEI